MIGRLGRQPLRVAARLVSIRSRWSLNIVKNFTIFRVSNQGELTSIIADPMLKMRVSLVPKGIFEGTPCIEGQESDKDRLETMGQSEYHTPTWA
jgi:hypothetical protein